MSDLKPIGSEKLPINEKIKRIMEIARYNEQPKSTNQNNNTETVHTIKEAVDGFYGVVREKDGYYVKHGLSETTLDYIGGMRMKNKNRFNSYAEALKRMELIAKPITEQAKKYVLGKPAVDEVEPSEPTTDAPPPSAEGGESAPPSDDMGGDAPVDDAPPSDEVPAADDMGGENMGGDETGVNGEAPLHMKAIQKLTGKLGQRLRLHADELKSNDFKYVINSVLSAIDLSKLEDSDREEIASRFEDPDYDESGELDSVDNTDSEFGSDGGSEEMPSAEGGDDMGGEDMGGEEVPTDDTEKEMGEEEFDDIFENFSRLQKIMKS